MRSRLFQLEFGAWILAEFFIFVLLPVFARAARGRASAVPPNVRLGKRGTHGEQDTGTFSGHAK